MIRDGKRPPPIARALMDWAARRLDAPELVDHADEILGQRADRDGARAARAWYRRQAMRAACRAIADGSKRAYALRRPGAARLDLASVARHVRLAGRRVRRDPAQVATFVVVVGTGIAATAFMAGTRSSMLHPDLGLGREVDLVGWTDSTGVTRPSILVAGDEEWLGAPAASVDKLVPFWPTGAVLETPQGLLRASGQRAEVGYFGDLGVAPWAGHDLDGPGQIVLAHSLWANRWSSAADAIGTDVSVDGAPMRIVGIAAPGFDGAICCVPPAFWIVGEPASAPLPAVVAAVGVRDRVAAAAWLSTVAADASRGSRASLQRAESAPYGGETGIVGRTLSVLVLLSVTTWLATLLSGANLLLSETLARRRELRLRRALGARPAHIVLQALAETAWLAVLASLVALTAASVMTIAAPWLLPMVGASSSVELTAGRATLATVAGAAATTTLACALPVALVALGIAHDPEVDRGPGRDRFSAVGLAAQISLAGALIVVTGLFVGSVRSMDGDFVGFRNGRTAVLYLSAAPGTEGVSPDAVLEAVAAIAPRAHVAITRRLPVYGARPDSVILPDGSRMSAMSEIVTSGFFETVGTGLVAGEVAGTEAEAVVSADLAALLGTVPADAIGQRVVVADTVALRVVGVVEAATWGTGSARPTVYRGWGTERLRVGFLLLGDERGSPVPIDALLGGLRPHGVALEPFETLDGLLVRSRLLTVFLTRLALLFGGLCLVVAIGGVHAHFMRWVRARTRALAVRSALGAPASRVGVEVVSAALTVVVPAAAVGCLAGWVAVGFLTSYLGEPGSAGAGLYAGAVVLLLSSTLLALAVPAVRAGRVDPVTLLKAS